MNEHLLLHLFSMPTERESPWRSEGVREGGREGCYVREEGSEGRREGGREGTCVQVRD